MKSLISRIAIALLITSLAGVSAFAKTRREKITFIDNIKVNGTLVTKGVYNLKFDDKTGEVSILKGSKVVARASVDPEKRDRKAGTFEVRSTGSGDTRQLLSVAFGGSDVNLVLRDSQASK
jgi:hypothetical protein